MEISVLGAQTAQRLEKGLIALPREAISGNRIVAFNRREARNEYTKAIDQRAHSEAVQGGCG